MLKFSSFFAFLILLLAGTAFAQTSDVTTKNKALYDQTVDKLNFRTIEFVYDRKYPRKKFPPNQSDFKTRKTFDDFDANAAFKKLFMNYNDVSEKFKKNYGKGSNDLPSFEKALSDILVNKDFEFFISSLNKDDKVQLIKSLQQINKNGIAQYVDASGTAVNAAAQTEENPDQVTQNTEIQETEETATPAAEPVINTDATPEEVFQEKTPRRDWLTWLTLIVSLAALAMAVSAKLKDIPGLRAFVANNYQRKGETAGIAVKTVSKSEENPDPEVAKQLGNLTREIEGLYAQMDELLHKNSVLEQKLNNMHPKPFDLPKSTYFEPVTNDEPLVSQVTAPAIQSPVVLTSNPIISDSESEETEEFYLGRPDKLGFFSDHDLTENETPESFYKITFPGSDHRKGNFEPLVNNASQQMALENRELYLKPVCEIISEEPGGNHIETETPGTVLLNDEQWVLVKKARIRIV